MPEWGTPGSVGAAGWVTARGHPAMAIFYTKCSLDSRVIRMEFRIRFRICPAILFDELVKSASSFFPIK